MALPEKVLGMLNRLRARRHATPLGSAPMMPPGLAHVGAADAPPGMVRLTRRLIHAGRNWTKEQLAVIGISWDDTCRAGWIGRAAGRLVTGADYLRFLAMRRPTRRDRKEENRKAIREILSNDLDAELDRRLRDDHS